jgi:phosphate-selective porin OprO/OprP
MRSPGEIGGRSIFSPFPSGIPAVKRPAKRRITAPRGDFLSHESNEGYPEMQIRSFLMAGTVTGLALAAGNAAAQSASEQIRAQQQQIDYMKHQIQVMQDKLEQLQATAQQTAQTQQKDDAAIQKVAAPAPHVTENAAHKLALESADGKYSIALTGRVHLDVGDYFNYQPQSKITAPQNLDSGFNARRARIGVVGKVDGDWTYGFIYDGGNSSDATPAGIQTAQIGYTGIKDVGLEIGYSDTFFTLDEATSSNDIMFMERASPGAIATGVNTGDFRSNAGIRYMNDRFWLGAYFTGPKNGDAHSPDSQTIGAFQRATVQVLQDPEYSLHLGVGVDEIIKAPNAGPGTANSVTLSDRPELRIDATSLVNTGALGTITSTGVNHSVDGGYIVDLEAAAGYQDFFAQGEYLHYDIDRIGLASATFDGEYGEVSWTVTGENRKYMKASGAYSGITPAHPFSLEDGEWGAWELAARYSYIDLTDNFVVGTPLTLQPDAVNGGKQGIFTAGVNWYPNSYMRFMINYVHADFDKVSVAASGKYPIGTGIGATSDAIALRSQVAW